MNIVDLGTSLGGLTVPWLLAAGLDQLGSGFGEVRVAVNRSKGWAN